MAKQKKLREFSADELLAELRQRECECAEKDAKTQRRRPMGKFNSSEISKALREAQKVIYGIDDRREAHEITDDDVRRNSDAVVALIDVSDIEENGDGTSTIRTVTFGTSLRLCGGERFRTQPTAPFCSGFLVAPDIIATAGHCVDGNNLGRTRFVFGFQMNPDGTPQLTIPTAEIFEGVGILDRKLESQGADYALVRLDRPATGKPISRVRRLGKIANDREVYVIGHPSGLPKKFAPGAAVRGNSDHSFFTANLDTYGGNSGSMVCNSETHDVEGILVRGETDFVIVDGCRISNVCPTSGCRGEDVTRVSEFVEHVPELDGDEDDREAGSLEERLDDLEDRVEEIRTIVKRIDSQL